jgi:hypothetical protein
VNPSHHTRLKLPYGIEDSDVCKRPYCLSFDTWRCQRALLIICFLYEICTCIVLVTLDLFMFFKTLATNFSYIIGFPPDNPAVYELYWSPSQVLARAHPNLIRTQAFLMSHWHSVDKSAQISTSHPVTYADRLRIRQPGDVGFALGPHIDSGSCERWEENGYGKGGVYDKIFHGNWEAYDPWESSCRLPVVSDLYNGAGGCSTLRMFQGWLSMSDTGAGEGTLMVNPLLGKATAYLLLRPFFRSKRSPAAMGSAFLDANNWSLESETTSVLHGAVPSNCQELNDALHPHLELASTMVHIPHVRPGDYVAWHCDSTLRLHHLPILYHLILTLYSHSCSRQDSCWQRRLQCNVYSSMSSDGSKCGIPEAAKRNIP